MRNRTSFWVVKYEGFGPENDLWLSGSSPQNFLLGIFSELLNNLIYRTISKSPLFIHNNSRNFEDCPNSRTHSNITTILPMMCPNSRQVPSARVAVLFWKAARALMTNGEKPSLRILKDSGNHIF